MVLKQGDCLHRFHCTVNNKCCGDGGNSILQTETKKRTTDKSSKKTGGEARGIQVKSKARTLKCQKWHIQESYQTYFF